MQPTLIRAFAQELEKQAVNISTLQSYLTRRAGQGIGGASALRQSLAGSTAKTSREALQSMDGLQRFRLKGIAEGGKANRAMQALPERVGLGQTAQVTRQRVENAVKAEAAGANTRAGGVPLSKNYEGYMTPSRRAYSPQHAEEVMGLKPGQYTQKAGPTALMKPQESSISGSRSKITEDTVPSRPNIPKHVVPMKPTFRPPALGARRAAAG